MRSQGKIIRIFPRKIPHEFPFKRHSCWFGFTVVPLFCLILKMSVLPCTTYFSALKAFVVLMVFPMMVTCSPVNSSHLLLFGLWYSVVAALFINEWDCFELPPNVLHLSPSTTTDTNFAVAKITEIITIYNTETILYTQKQ